MRLPLLALLAALLATGATAQRAAPATGDQRSAFETAITVNDVPITYYDIDQRMKLLRFNGAPANANLQAIAVEQLIEDRLKRAAGDRLGIRPTRASETELVNAFATNTRRNAATIDRDLARAGATRAALLDALNAEATWREVVRRRFGTRAEPTEADIDQAIALAAAGRNREFRLAELVLPTGQRGEAATRALAEQLRDQLNAGGDFAAAVRRYSASASARDGGNIGWIAEGSLPEPVLAALADTRPGGVTQPLSVPGAVAMLKLLETRNIDIPGSATLNIALVAMNAQDRDPITAIARLDAVIAQGPTCETAEGLARSAGLSTARSEPRPLSTLPEPVRNAVGTLQPGQISTPVVIQGGAAAFIVCSRQEGVSAQEREAIRGRLRQERFVRFSNSYIQELRADAVIERR